MRSSYSYVSCLVASLALLCFTPAQTKEKANEKDGLHWIWYPTAKCNSPPPKGAPGSSPKTAIPVKYFENLYSFALQEAGVPAGVRVGEDEFKPDCKWVRLTGFFRWLNYYHYRGSLFEDAKSFYFKRSVRYIIEDFGDKKVRRGDLHGRRVTLVGRFYNLCAAAERDEKSSGQDWFIIGGPCHYGRDKGMMLKDVLIEEVQDDRPRFLTGEQNRAIIDELVSYKGKDLQTLKEKTRAWAALVKSGPQSYAKEMISTDPWYADKKPEEVEEARKRITDPDSYVSYLSKLPAFRKLDVAKAMVAVFRNQYYVEDMRDDQAVGCICLTDNCADKWPLLDGDAERFLGAAACTKLSRSTIDPVWRW